MIYFRSEFEFNKRIEFPHEALRKIPLKLLLHRCEVEESLQDTLYPSFIAHTSYVLPELLIFDQIPNEVANTWPFTAEEIKKTVDQLLDSITHSNYELSNNILQKIQSFDSSALILFWTHDKAFDVLKNDKNPR